MGGVTVQGDPGDAFPEPPNGRSGQQLEIELELLPERLHAAFPTIGGLCGRDSSLYDPVGDVVTAQLPFVSPAPQAPTVAP